MQIYTIQWIYLSVYSFLNGDFILLQTYKPAQLQISVAYFCSIGLYFLV